MAADTPKKPRISGALWQAFWDGMGDDHQIMTDKDTEMAYGLLIDATYGIQSKRTYIALGQGVTNVLAFLEGHTFLEIYYTLPNDYRIEMLVLVLDWQPAVKLNLPQLGFLLEEACESEEQFRMLINDVREIRRMGKTLLTELVREDLPNCSRVQTSAQESLNALWDVRSTPKLWTRTLPEDAMIIGAIRVVKPAQVKQ